MSQILPGQFLTQMRWRYAVKQFDPSRTIPADVWSALEETLVLSPSSYGLQPWKFVVVTNPAVKSQLVTGSYGQRQPADCSHHVVFAVRTRMEESDIDRHIMRTAELRGVAPEALSGFRKLMVGAIVNGVSAAAQVEWAARQAYIALGNLMTAAAVLGVDACPMEGIDPRKYDEVLDLARLGYQTCVACAVGYRAVSDKNATLPKVRFPREDVLLRVE